MHHTQEEVILVKEGTLELLLMTAKRQRVGADAM